MIVAGHNFAEKLAHLLNARFVDIEKRTFPDGEVCPRLLTDSVDKYAVLAERMAAAEYHNRHLIEVLFSVRNLRSMGAEKIDVVMPYFVYSRQDKAFRPGEPSSAKFVLEMLADAGATRFFTVSSHAERHSDRISFSPIPAYNINGFVAIAEYLKGMQFLNPIIIGPDEGAASFVETVAGSLKYEMGIFHKKRDPETGEVSMNTDIDVKGRDVIIIDDIVSSGSTMVNAINICKKSGARKIYCAVVHIISEKCVDMISSMVDKFVACNTIHSSVSVIPIEKMVADKIKEVSL